MFREVHPDSQLDPRAAEPIVFSIRPVMYLLLKFARVSEEGGHEPTGEFYGASLSAPRMERVEGAATS